MSRLLRSLDALLEYLGIVLLGAIVLIVTWGVVARTISGTEQEWTEQVPIALMIWMVALGVAIGFREQSHTSVELAVEKLSRDARTWVLRLTHSLVIAFGLFLIVRGLQLTFEHEQWALYAAMPISGFMTCVYAALQLMGVRTQRSVTGEAEGESSTGSFDE